MCREYIHQYAFGGNIQSFTIFDEPQFIFQSVMLEDGISDGVVQGAEKRHFAFGLFDIRIGPAVYDAFFIFVFI